MKKALLALCATLLVACKTLSPLQPHSMDDSINFRVTCHNDNGTRSTVLLLLKQAKARDLREMEQIDQLEIQASYYKDDNAPGKLAEIADRLSIMVGVYFVEVRENSRVIKQNR